MADSSTPAPAPVPRAAVEQPEDTPTLADPFTSPPEHKPLLPSWARWNPQLRLRNTGAVARDHLANERTWLAYTRTSLSIASTGVALVQLFALSAQQNAASGGGGGGAVLGAEVMRVAKPLGAVTIAFGLVVLIIGSTRYYQIQTALTEDMFPPTRTSPLVISGMMLAIVVAVFAVVVTLTNS